ncbi:response regulator transcription factor [Virgibacillus pantothenticus]|uniref:Response regulatory domain-containing protein n=1 Tax=Virgibacillus pantothenticus TaxID=1473 RepID=A0A0L0QTZ3_VIRPA|nr:hypothetical protein AFK71_04435 [Virgibacillus pantothenticus]QTY17294.1 response regulator transcription factor [Virgibacillus pantothenticus]SIS93807.1 Response regulator receiver domain-containing protein [Virgibacillus pantothenticus]
MVHVLYIEDEREIGSWVKKDLTRRGYDITWLKSAEEANRYISHVDIVILDIMLPGLDGFYISLSSFEKSITQSWFSSNKGER